MVIKFKNGFRKALITVWLRLSYSSSFPYSLLAASTNGISEYFRNIFMTKPLMRSFFSQHE